MKRRFTVILSMVLAGLAFNLVAAPATAQTGTGFSDAWIDSVGADLPEFVRDAYKQVGIVWQGPERYMTFSDFASYCAPILWFSPDEPLLDETTGKEIRMPTAFPFEDQVDAPVVYFRFRTITKSGERWGEGDPVVDTDFERLDTLMDLRFVTGVDLDFFFFYPHEEGFGAHQYDVESVQMKCLVVKAEKYPELGYWIVIQKVVGKAHGILWYDNNLVVDKYTQFPMTILVEEGKHASCTDKNGDGAYSPGYDVNRRVNDAWGVRDIARSGMLFTASFNTWMAKVRRPEHRVFPPLPEDSFLREHYSEDGVYAPDNAIYEVRPFPRSEPAEAYDPHLTHFVADKGSEDWPEIITGSTVKTVGHWVTDESFIKSLTLSYRYDGLSGFSFVFPLLIVKPVQDPLAGGWIMNRLYFRDYDLRDIAWNFLYTLSASRWVDPYFAAGVEWDSDGTNTTTYFMTEMGLKFRTSISTTPLSFLGGLTDFMGVRLGIKSFGLAPVSNINWVIEIGAGSF